MRFCGCPGLYAAPFLAESGAKVTEPVSSIDVTPTLLALLGVDVGNANFDGVNALGEIPKNRKVYFSGWMQQGPAGFVQGDRKFIYNPTDKTVSVYGLSRELRIGDCRLPIENRKSKIVNGKLKHPFESQRGELSELQPGKLRRILLHGGGTVFFWSASSEPARKCSLTAGFADGLDELAQSNIRGQTEL